MKVIGEIIGGEGRATRLGFPTFNMVLPGGVEDGVYAGKAKYVGDEYKAVIFADERRGILEAHLLGFDTKERERTIEIEILDKIRGTRVFKNDEDLVERIKKDIEGVYK